MHARRRGLWLVVHAADWSRHGRAAGPIRNAAMLARRPERVLAFPGPESRGTWDLVRRARRLGIPVEVHEVSE
jgi:hypothetical protein